ncbi:hypothetical protein JVU11DRAFT_8306 [Chiua virens]|nr:hypothetical protein JVU11DRAFT_8306 [Chiua virens]
MSSSGYHPSPHLHRVSLHSHGKRPFEECGGYDSDPDNMPIQPTTTSGSSSNNHRFSSISTPAQETRNKRARSTSSSSTDVSNPSSSSGYNTAQSSSRSDLSSDGPSVLPANAVDCPVHPVISLPSFVSTHDVHMSDLHLPIPPIHPQRTHVPTPPTPEDTLRTSLQRFAEFDRQIAALRTSLAATRSSPLPPLGPSVGDPVPSADHWHPNPSNFLSNASSGLPASTTTGIASSTEAVAPSETLNSLNSLPAFASSNDSANVITPTSTDSGGVPSASFPPTYSNLPRYPPHPSYRPSPGGLSSLVADQRVGDAIASSSTPSFMRPPSNENAPRVAIRSSVSVEASAAPATSHIRRVRGSLSPLVFPPDLSSPPTIITDDILPRHRSLNDDRDPADGRSHRRGIDSPVPGLDREVLSRSEDRSGEQPWLSSQTRLGPGVRVIGERSTEREAVPSVFDVFNIGESSSDRIRPSSVREPVTSRYPSIAEPVPPRVPGTHNERSRGPVPTATTVNQGHSQDLHTRLHSSWTSIPSSNSLMSESASERRHALAIERFRTRARRSSIDADDESDTRWSSSSRGERERESARDLGIASPVPPSPSVESVPGTNSHFPSFRVTRVAPSMNRVEPASSASLPRSVSELFAETHREFEGVEDWLLDWGETQRGRGRDRDPERERERERERQLDRERQRERVWEWERERQRERSNQDVRDESSHPLVPASSALPRPTLGQLAAGPSTAMSNVTATATNNNQQYSYSNLNLSSFQSGLFRDSLRRNAEVDQPSFSSNGPVIPPVFSGDSRAASRLGLEDSGSEIDFDDFVRTRPPSPEWSRPQPYAGRTPPPDYSPPPRNFSLRPGGFSYLRRGSIIAYDPQARSQPPTRNSFIPPVQPAASGPTRPIPARILESIYRSQEDGRRNGTTGAGPTYHSQQNHAPTPGTNTASRNERNDVGGPRGTSGNGNGNRAGSEVVRENRRSSLGLGGSIRSRLARFTNPQSSSNTSDASSPSRQRSPPHPIGARPQATEQHPHRRASVLGAAMVEHESRSEGRVTGPPHWAANTGSAESAVTRDVPWRASSGPRFAPPPPPTSNSVRAEMSETAGRGEESRSRLRTLRQRFQLDRGSDGMRVFRPGMLRAAMGRRGNFGDYVPDELFDDSYEALLSLSSMLGEVRSRATPEEVIASLPTGTFREWKKADSETRCPICLDDYEPSDVLTKLIECTHWLHKNCLEQWLRTANTCPVCREKVKTSPKPAPARRRPYRDPSGPSETNHGASNSSSGNGQNSQSGRAPPTNPPSNSGRPVSFAAMVFDRMMNDGRDTPVEPWLSSSSPVPAPPVPRDVRGAFLERVRIQAQQQQQRAREPPQPPHTHDYHDVYMSEPPYHLRARPTSQSGSSPARQMGGAGTSGMDGTSGRPFGFLLRGQGSDTSMSTTSSRSNTNMVVDDVSARHEPSGRRSMAGGPGFDGPMPRWENMFPLIPSSSSNAFNGGGGPAPSSVPTTQSGFEAHPPTMVISSSTDSTREWRDTRMYDALFSGETSRSSSSSLGSFSTGHFCLAGAEDGASDGDGEPDSD